MVHALFSAKLRGTGGRGGEGEGRKEKKEIPRAMTSDEKSKSFAGGVDADRDEKKKKKRRKYRTFEVKMAMKTFGLAFIEPLLLILLYSFRFVVFSIFFFLKIYLSLKDEFLIEI